MKYHFVSNYQDHAQLRSSFNRLLEKVYYFNLERWYDGGFWSKDYIPYSLLDGEQVIANVSVNRMIFWLDGIKKYYLQIGTVMTDPEYRGLGLSKYLIEKVITDYNDQVDGIYLFANDGVLDFYPKFGFTRGKEYQYSKMIIKSEHGIEVVNVNDKDQRLKFINALKNGVYNSRFFTDNSGLLMFYLLGSMGDQLYYYEKIDAYIIAEINDENLMIYQIISKSEVDLDFVINAFGKIKKVTLGFTPINPEGFEVCEYLENDCTLFYLGDDLKNIEDKKLMFPILSHA